MSYIKYRSRIVLLRHLAASHRDLQPVESASANYGTLKYRISLRRAWVDDHKLMQFYFEANEKCQQFANAEGCD